MADANEVVKKWRSLIVGASDVAWTTARVPSAELLSMLLHIDAQAAEIERLKIEAPGTDCFGAASTGASSMA